MKDILRRHHVLKEDIVDILNKQVKMEAHSSAAYLAMAAWCDSEGFDKSAEHFFNQAEEERNHMLKIFHYLVDMEALAISPGIDQVNHEFSSLKEVFETALEQEMAVTDAIHNIVGMCRKENDIATEEFIKWFVQEQIEEEFVARKMVELFDTFGEDKLALAMIEDRIPTVQYDGGTAEPGA